MNKTEAPRRKGHKSMAETGMDSVSGGSGWDTESTRQHTRIHNKKKEENRPSGLWEFLKRKAAALTDAGSAAAAAKKRTSDAKTTRAIRRALRALTAFAAIFLSAFYFSGAPLAYGMQPLGIAWICAAGTGAGTGLLGGIALPAALIGVAAALLSGVYGAYTGLYFGALLLSVGVRYAAGRFLSASEETEEFSDWKPRDAVSFGEQAMAIGRVLFPPGVFAQTVAVRVGVSVMAACPIAAGILLGAEEIAQAICEALFVLCGIPMFTFLFCGVFDRNVSPAHREGGIGALCYAWTISFTGITLLGFSLKMIAAHAITLYISKKGGYLRGGLSGLVCGFACDALYAPAYALIGAVSGLFWKLHRAAAIVLSLCAGAAYAVYIGEFAALRSVVPEMIAVSALAYPVVRYVPELYKAFEKSELGILLAGEDKPIPPLCTQEDNDRVTPEQLGMPGLCEQLDTLSGILNGLSATFYHLSDRQKKPGLFEIRQMCESISERYCAGCAHHTLCWEKEFSSTADAMGRITLCIHRKGRADAMGAFAPLDKRCPYLPKMLAAMNEAAAVLCEEKMMKDKTEVAAGDYEGMARLLRASAAETARACEKDAALSRRLGRAMGRMGFRAREVSVFGERRRTVIARGVDLGFLSAGEGVYGIADGGNSAGVETLLGTEELREAFSALAGVSYRPPEYSLTAGGAELVMTMHARAKVSVTSGAFGEKKDGEEVTGDVASLFANRSDYFYALLCDGMGSGREASVTAQISTLFLEKLLSVSCAKGAALNLLNGYLRSRAGECSATVDLCEIDMITADAHFIKCGAAATYLLRGENMFRIASKTTPLGILREVAAEETTLSLADGDLLLFFSDGVCGECEDASWIPDEIARARKEYARLKTRACSIRCDQMTEDKASEDTSPDASASENEAAAASAADSDAEPEPTMLFMAGGDGKRTKRQKELPSPLDFLAKSIGQAAKERIGRQDDMTVILLGVQMN